MVRRDIAYSTWQISELHIIPIRYRITSISYIWWRYSRKAVPGLGNSERVLQVFADGRHVPFDSLFVRRRVWPQRSSGQVHNDTMVGRTGKVKLLS